MIVVLHGAPAFGAVESYVSAIVRALAESEEDVRLLHPDVPELGPFAALAGGHVQVETIDVDGPAPLVALRVARRLRRLKPRVVHVTDVWAPGMLAARLAGRRRIVTHHTPELPRHDNAIGSLFLRAAWATRPEVIYTSDADRRKDGRAPAHVVPLGIELDRYASPRAPAGVVGTVGRLAPQKDQLRLVEAAPLVLERHPEIVFEIVGDGELREELTEAIRARGLEDSVRLLGGRDDVPELLAHMDVFAMPSLFEGLCVAVVEAQAAGVPVVATAVGGMVETVVPGETGVQVPAGDARALADGILWVLAHPDEAAALAAEAQRRARARFSLEQMTEGTLAVYRRSGASSSAVSSADPPARTASRL